MSYRQTYSKLAVASLTPEQHAKTCGYWYVVQNQCMAHTAFATKEHLQKWADERGLTLPELPANRGEHSCGDIKGSYSDAMHMDPEAFHALRPNARHVLKLSNGDYTRGLIHDEGGHKVVHYLNPNVHEREVFDYFKSRELVG